MKIKHFNSKNNFENFFTNTNNAYITLTRHIECIELFLEKQGYKYDLASVLEYEERTSANEKENI